MSVETIVRRSVGLARDGVKRLVQRSPEDTDEYRKSAEILKGWPSLEGTDASKLEYLKHLVAMGADDMKHVTVYISLAFGVTALLLSGKVSEALLKSPMYVRLTMVLGVSLLAMSGIFFYRYVRKIHLARMAITRCIPTLDTTRARELWGGKAGVWSIHGRAYKAGWWLLFLGLTCEGLVAISIII
jgi:hypothetical protein